MRRYKLIIDTNIIYNEEFNTKIFKNKLLEKLYNLKQGYEEFFGELDLIEILIPEIVIKERLEQKKRIFYFEAKQIQKKIKQLDNSKLTESFDDAIKDFEKKLIENSNKFFQHFDIKKIPICDKSHFNDIIEKGVKKILPFKPLREEKGKRIGERGFADCIIWYSIIDYAKKMKYSDNEKLIFITKNKKDFISERNLKEFKEETGNNIIIINFRELDQLLFKDFQEIQINKICIFFSKEGDKNYINGISLFFKEMSLEISYTFDEFYERTNFEETIKSDITLALEKMNYDTKNLKFEFNEVHIVFIKIYLRAYKGWFYDFLDVTLDYTDGTERELDIDNFDQQLSIIDYVEESENILMNYLKSKGFDLDFLDGIDVKIGDSVEDTS